MLGNINFPEGITWDIKYLNGYDMCGEGFSATTMEYAYTQGQMPVVDIKYDTSKVTNFSGAFYYCQKLIKCPDIDMTSATSASYMFYYCTNLPSIPLLDTSNGTDFTSMFHKCTNLTDLGGFKGLKADLNLTSSKKLTHESLMNVINNLAEVNTNPTLSLGSENLAKLTDDEKTIAINKGWILA